MQWDNEMTQRRADKKAAKHDAVVASTVSFALKVMPGFVDDTCKVICDIVDDFSLADTRDIAGIGMAEGYKVTVYESGSILFQRMGKSGILPDKAFIRGLLIQHNIRLCG